MTSERQVWGPPFSKSHKQLLTYLGWRVHRADVIWQGGNELTGTRLKTTDMSQEVAKADVCFLLQE